MIAHNFQYVVPSSLGEAVNLLQKHAGRAKILAGGHSLIPMMKLRLAAPEFLIDIGRIRELSYVKEDSGKVRIGALTTHYAIETSDVIQRRFSALADAAGLIGDIQVRNKGTIGGSIAHADPAAEWCLVAAALEAEMVARRATGTRTIPARDFFRGIMTTALGEDELLTEVRLPMLPADTRFGFYEFNRRAGDFALAMALVTFRVQDGVIAEPCVAVGGVEPQPRRIAQAEQVLVGRPPDHAAFQAAAAAVASAVDPLEDANTSATYRRDLARTVTRRALEQAAA